MPIAYSQFPTATLTISISLPLPMIIIVYIVAVGGVAAIRFMLLLFYCLLLNDFCFEAKIDFIFLFFAFKAPLMIAGGFVLG